jgi:GxxExxY protein
MDKEKIATQLIDSAIKVHSHFGPGLLESAYQKCLAYELSKRGIKVQTEIIQPLFYDNISIDAGYRIDMLIEDCIIVENKTVEQILGIHEAQLLTYMKLRGCSLGFILNWKVKLLKNGIVRRVL